MNVQQDEQGIAREPASGGEAGASASVPVSGPDSGRYRDRRGRFLHGNTISLKHGRWSRAVANALLPEQIDTLAVLADHEAAILVDLSGQSELTTFERDLVRRYQQLDAVAAFNAPRMLAQQGSVRRDARDTFMSCVDRQIRIISLLGLQRRAKDIGDLTITDYMRHQEQIEQQQQHQHQHEHEHEQQQHHEHEHEP